jgi:hypothetical protein
MSCGRQICRPALVIAHATTKAMQVIAEEERQSRQSRPAGARRAGGHQESNGWVRNPSKESALVEAPLEPTSRRYRNYECEY